MHGRSIVRVFALMVVGLLLMPGSAASQQKTLKEQLVGTWMMLSARNIKADGTSEDIFGPNGKGILIFQQNGRFAFVLVNPDIPKFASNNRVVAAPAEFEAAYKGSFASFGRYSVNDADRTFIFHMEYSTFPNFKGVDQKRIVKAISLDELEIVSETSTIGGVSAFRLRREN
jgi:hypothetical protein